jgi:hypothetical protein
MKRSFCDQHCSTDFRHHSTLRRDARRGFPPTVTKTGFVCDEPRMRSATQLDRSIGTSKARSLSSPSARTTLDATGS